MADLEEAKVAVEAIKPLGRPVVISFVFDSGRNLDRTMTGVTPERAAKELTDAGADVIVDDASLSRIHFTISRDGAAFVLTDMSSQNGTWVDGTPLRTPECLTFELTDDGRIRRVEVFTQTRHAV